MPVLSSFNGIIITMYFESNGKHHKPHIHADYGEYSACIGVDGRLLGGYLPRKQMRAVKKWLAAREDAVYRAWNIAVAYGRIERIPPL